MLLELLEPASATVVLPLKTNLAPNSRADDYKSERVCFKTFPWSTERPPIALRKDQSEWHQQFRVGLWNAVYAALESVKVLDMVENLRMLTSNEFATFVKGEQVISQGLMSREEVQGRLNTQAHVVFAKLFAMPPVERRTALRMAGGADPEQIRLYADYLYCASFEGVIHEPGTISNCISQAKARSGLKSVEKVKLDDAELLGYFSKQSLINLMAIEVFKARGKNAGNDLRLAVDLIADYVDALPNLQAHFNLSGDPTAQVLGTMTAMNLAKLDLDGPVWRRTAVLNELGALSGFIKEGTKTTLFLGKLHLSAIEFDGHHWSILSHDEAANKVRSVCSSRASYAEDTGLIHTFSPLPISNGKRISFADGVHVDIRSNEIVLLEQGFPAPDWHPLSIRMRSEALHWLVSNPFMEKEGGVLAEYDRLAFGIKRAYPGATIARGPIDAKTLALVAGLSRMPLPKAADFTLIVGEARAESDTGRSLAQLLTLTNKLPITIRQHPCVEKYSGPVANLIVIAASEEPGELPALVEKLGENGYFNRNFVIFAPFSTAPGRSLLAQITERFGAVATYSFDGKARPEMIQSCVTALAAKASGNERPLLLDALRQLAKDEHICGIVTL